MKIFKNILAVLAGLLFGGIVNMALIYLGPHVIANPPGVDMTTPEGLKAGMSLLESKHFIFPFLAHALGTLVGAWTAAKIGTNPKVSAYIVGAFFLLGGITNCVSLPGAPVWFMAADLILAYFPMAWLGLKLATQNPKP